MSVSNIFNVNWFIFNQPEEITHVQTEGTIKLPVLDELHEYIFSFLDENSQQNVVFVNRFWCEIGLKSAKSFQIEKIKNFINNFILNLDNQNLAIKEGFEVVYKKKREQILALSTQLPSKLDSSSFLTFKNSLLPLKELMVWNLREIIHSIFSNSIKHSFKTLKIDEPFLLKNYFELTWLDFKYESANGDVQLLSSLAHQFLKIGEFERAFITSTKIEENDVRDPICYEIIKNLIQNGEIEKAKYLEKQMPETETLYIPSLPIYLYYKDLGNYEMAKEYRKKVTLANKQGASLLAIQDIGL